MIPTLQSLSEGQSQLFHLFTTIIRYGESADINRSIRLPEITGLVLIDEIDAHLHASLQHEVSHTHTTVPEGPVYSIISLPFIPSWYEKDIWFGRLHHS